MRIFSLVMLSLLMFTNQVLAGFFVESHHKVVDGQDTMTMNFSPTHNVTDKIQVWSYCLIGKNWSEGYGGLAYSPKSWLQIGAAAGMETNESPYRVAGFVWTGRGLVSGIAYYEIGGSGYWYLIKGTFKLNKLLTIGALAKRFSGAGPIIQISFPKTPLKVWVMPAYDFADKKQKMLFGAIFTM